MYAEYAKDPRMKLNLGIRRRLAPLLDNGRDEIELMHAILFSLPGLAGPLLRRRDRDGRQHLPRRPRRRAHADAVDGRPQRRLLARRLRAALPAAADGSRSTASRPSTSRRSCGTPTSLLRWLHRFIALRKEHPVFGLGTYEALRPGQPADLRARPPLRGRHRALRAQPRALGAGGRARPLAVRRAWCPRRCSAGRASRAIGELPYLLTLAPRGFFWFQLRRGRTAS